MALSTGQGGVEQREPETSLSPGTWSGPHNSVASPRRQTPRAWSKKKFRGRRSIWTVRTTLTVGEIGLADSVRPLKDFDCIPVYIEAHRTVRRIVTVRPIGRPKAGSSSALLPLSGLNPNFKRTPLSA